MSRLTGVKDAIRPEMKARLLLAGPAGAGKTWSALTIARALTDGEPPLLIDTEEESALTYADDFHFKHLAWDPPYNPQELAEVVLEAASEYPAIIIDSATHFWNDEGGTLETADSKFTGWKKARPIQRDFVKAVLRARTHMLVCTRSKMEHAQVVKDGRQVVEKLGMAPIQDSTLEYEVNVSLDLSMAHTLSVSKTRCHVLADREFPAGHAADLAQLYRDWLRGGEPVADTEQVAGLVEAMSAIADEDTRKKVKREFVARFGKPDFLLAAKVDEALSWVAAQCGPGEGPDGNQPRLQAVND